MKLKTFQDFLVWQKAHQFVLRIYKITKLFPYEEKFGLTSQLRRSASSITANIAEGYKKSRKDFVRFLDISQGSLEESKNYLILAKDLEYLQESDFHNLFELSSEVGRMVFALQEKLRL